MNRTTKWVAAIVLAHVLLLLLYWAFERTSRPEPSLGTWPADRIDRASPALTIKPRAGGERTLRRFERPTLIHFWATWCPPCREELPAILDLQQRDGLDVVAIAVDDNWGAIDQLLLSSKRHRASPLLFLASSEQVASAFEVHALPVTFLAGPGDRLRLRFEGPREWEHEGFVESFLEELDPRGR